MATEVFANNASTTLQANVTTTPAAGTSELWTVASTSLFPQIGTGGTQQFRATIGPTSDTNPEIVICTQINSATTMTVTRGAEGSPIKQHVIGDPVINTLTAALLAAAFQSRYVTAFNSSGTYTIPPDTKNVRITCIGAGGGGAAGPNFYPNYQYNNGAGGGATGGVVQEIVPVGANTSLTVAIGSGGAGGGAGTGAAGSSGGSSSVSGTGISVSAPGGGGGLVAQPTTQNANPGGGYAGTPVQNTSTTIPPSVGIGGGGYGLTSGGGPGGLGVPLGGSGGGGGGGIAIPTSSSFVSASNTASAPSVTSLACPVPTGLVVGNLLVAWWWVNVASTMAAPAGWTVIALNLNLQVGTVAMAYRWVTGTEAASYTFLSSASGPMQVHMAQYTGVGAFVAQNTAGDSTELNASERGVYFDSSNPAMGSANSLGSGVGLFVGFIWSTAAISASFGTVQRTLNTTTDFMGIYEGASPTSPYLNGQTGNTLQVSSAGTISGAGLYLVPPIASVLGGSGGGAGAQGQIGAGGTNGGAGVSTGGAGSTATSPGSGGGGGGASGYKPPLFSDGRWSLSSGATNIVQASPENNDPGNVTLIAVVFNYGVGGATSISPPAGWTTYQLGTFGPSADHYGIFTKAVGAGEPTSYTFTTQSGNAVGYVSGYREWSGIDAVYTGSTSVTGIIPTGGQILAVGISGVSSGSLTLTNMGASAFLNQKELQTVVGGFFVASEIWGSSNNPQSFSYSSQSQGIGIVLNAGMAGGAGGTGAPGQVLIEALG